MSTETLINNLVMRGLGPDTMSLDGRPGFLLWYSDVYTAKSLSLFYLLFISEFVSTRR